MTAVPSLAGLSVADAAYLRRQMQLRLMRHSPTDLAHYASEKRWRPFWHLRLLAHRLERVARHGGNLIVMLPPQHGKSTLTSRYFPAWVLGTFPDKRVILASYASDYAETWGGKVRDTVEELGPELWGLTVSNQSSAAGEWDLALTGNVNGRRAPEGGMVATGVGGAITGRKADIFITDDPIKNDEEAQSEVDREKKYQWHLTVSLTRCAERAGKVIIITRWHEDDLVGRLIRDMEHGTGERWEVLRLPAIAEEDEHWEWEEDGEKVTHDRRKGEPLCPELFSLETLRVREGALMEYNWSRTYQQRPFARGGGMFRVAALRERTVACRPPEPKHTIRGWDLAATEKKDSKRTAGVRISQLPASNVRGADGVIRPMPGDIYVEHVVCGKWTPDRRNAVMKGTSDAEAGIKIAFEHEGGSAGEDQALAITRLLLGHRTEAVKVSGDKVARADAVAAAVNAGLVHLVDDGTWDVEGFLAELEAFPNGTYKDQVDALSLAFNLLVKTGPPLRGHVPPEQGWRRDLGDRMRGAPDRDALPPTMAEMDVNSPPDDWRGEFDRKAGR